MTAGEKRREEKREKRGQIGQREREVIVLDKALQLHVLLKQLILYLRNITSDKTNLFKTKKKGGKLLIDGQENRQLVVPLGRFPC